MEVFWFVTQRPAVTYTSQAYLLILSYNIFFPNNQNMIDIWQPTCYLIFQPLDLMEITFLSLNSRQANKLADWNLLVKKQVMESGCYGNTRSTNWSHDLSKMSLGCSSRPIQLKLMVFLKWHPATPSVTCCDMGVSLRGLNCWPERPDAKPISKPRDFTTVSLEYRKILEDCRKILFNSPIIQVPGMWQQIFGAVSMK